MAANPAFPELIPSERKFTLGDYPSVSYRSLSGVVFKRSFGNKQTGYTLDLTFKNVKDASAYEIVDHYASVDGTFATFKLPNKVFRGMSDDLEASIQAPHADVKWRYASPPEVQSVHRDLSTVTVKLVGDL